MNDQSMTTERKRKALDSLTKKEKFAERKLQNREYSHQFYEFIRDRIYKAYLNKIKEQKWNYAGAHHTYWSNPGKLVETVSRG